MSEALFGGAEGDQSEGALTAWARAAVVVRIQSYCRLTFGKVDNGVLTLSGTPGRRLVIGERPLRAVTSVVLDGAALAPADYRWTRAGALWRDSGWGDESRQVVLTASYGFLAIPRDIASVVDSASLRLVVNPEAWKSMQHSGEGEHGASRTLVAEAPSGFTVGELMVLRRYRRMTT